MVIPLGMVVIMLGVSVIPFGVADFWVIPLGMVVIMLGVCVCQSFRMVWHLYILYINSIKHGSHFRVLAIPFGVTDSWFFFFLVISFRYSFLTFWLLSSI